MHGAEHWLHIHVHTHIHKACMNTHTYIYTCAWTHINFCMHTYTCTQIHTYTHTHMHKYEFVRHPNLANINFTTHLCPQALSQISSKSVMNKLPILYPVPDENLDGRHCLLRAPFVKIPSVTLQKFWKALSSILPTRDHVFAFHHLHSQ